MSVAGRSLPKTARPATSHAQETFMDAVYVIGMAIYAGLMGVLARLVAYRLISRHVPELALVPSDFAREPANCNTLAAAEKAKQLRRFWAAIVPSLGIMIVFSFVRQAAFPTVLLVVFIVLSLIPVFAMAHVWVIRGRLRRSARRGLLQMGIAVCQACGAAVKNRQVTACQQCGQRLGKEVLRVAGTPSTSTAEKIPASSAPWRVWLVPVVVLLIVAVPLPFLMYLIGYTGPAWQDAWRCVQVPGELTFHAKQPERYGIFVPVETTYNEATFSVRVVDARTGQELPVEPTSSGLTHLTSDEKEVKVVRAVNLPAAGSYQVVVNGPEPGIAYLVPSLRARSLKVIAVAAATLVGLLLFVLVVILLAGRRKAAELRQT